jgi:hypothetical protein
MASVGKRSRGRQSYRWQDEVLKDIRVLGVKNWTKVVITHQSGMIWWRSQKSIRGCRMNEED